MKTKNWELLPLRTMLTRWVLPLSTRPQLPQDMMRLNPLLTILPRWTRLPSTRLQLLPRM